MNKKNIYLVGAGGHTRSLINLISKDTYDIKGIYDDYYEINIDQDVLGVKIIENKNNISINSTLILSVGDNNKRKILFENFSNQILKENLVHVTSFFESECFMGKSNQFFANTYVNSFAKIGDNNIINSGAIIEHESVIGSHNHISVGAIICGRVKIGNQCFIGAGSVIIDKVKISDNVIIGANSVITNDILTPGTYVGCPVKKIK